MASISKRVSGAWQNTSYGIRATATDTITTLPTTIYGDGTNATVSIKGNTVQSGTPTPDNPVIPEGCGVLETIGEKVGQYKIPISSANTTTPVYLSEVQSTRKIKKLVLTGEEAWSSYSGVAYLSNIIDYLKTDGIVVLCSHYQPQPSVEGVSETTTGHIAFSKGINFRLCIRDNTYTSGADFKTYLATQYAAGTPVIVWYVLEAAETGIVNEPLMKISDYADEVSSISIPTTDGANTLSVDTTIQPSEVSINYHGWHMGTVHERVSGQWD